MLLIALTSGCVAPAEDVGDEAIETSEQQLFTPIIPIPIAIYPAWRKACPSGTYHAGAITPKYFVRRASDCANVAGTTGSWVGSRLFWEGSGWCSYRWNSTLSTPTANDHWALNGITQMPTLPPSFTGEGTINPLVIPNCQSDTVVACGLGITCVAAPASNTVCDPYGNCSVELGKIVNPCGTCGVKGGPSQRLAIVVPPDWTRSELVIAPWYNYHYGPSHLQTFQALPTMYDVVPPAAGTPVQLGVRP